MLNMSYSFRQIKKYGSNCKILQFSPSEFRLDVSIGQKGKLEKLSKINGEPHADEYTFAKMNGCFFNMNGSTEYIGTFVDEGLYYQGSSYYYPTLIFWKTGPNANKLTVELHPDQARCAYYQGNAWWAIGCPWTLILDGQVNYSYDRKTLIENFGHPWQYAPRSLIGQRADGTIVMVVVDGRKAGSPGYTIDQSAQIMKDLGCVIACNCDGGGSTEMIVNNAIVNTPSDKAERSIGTAFMVYAKKQIAPASNPTGYKKATTTASSLNVRSGPGTGYAKVSQLPKGSTVYVMSEANGWCRIVLGNSSAYVCKSYLIYS